MILQHSKWKFLNGFEGKVVTIEQWVMVFKITLHASFLDCCKNVHKQQRTTNDDRKIQLKALYIIQILVPWSSIFFSFPRHQDWRMSNVVHIYVFPILEPLQRDHVTNYINVDSKKILSYNKHGNLNNFFPWKLSNIWSPETDASRNNMLEKNMFVSHTKHTQRKINESTSFAIDNMYYVSFKI